MAYCKFCGAQIADGSAFCSQCGAKNAAQPSEQNPNAQYNPNAQQYNPNAQQYNPHAQSSPYGQQYDPAAADIAKNKGYAALSYLGILILIPLLTVKDSPYTKFHMNQGLVLLIASVAASTVYGVLNGVGLDTLSHLVSLLMLAIFVFRIIGIVYALTGKQKELPLIGQIKLIK